ncbi:MAG: hypothetical protein Q4F53_06350, partial [Nesterenkonia sp.]|nr:hypothetical protein [Nesterenkonia sp.]
MTDTASQLDGAPRIDSVRALVRRIARSPRATGAAVGLLNGAAVLVPMRRWPRPLREGVLWGLPILVGLGAASVVLRESAGRRERPSAGGVFAVSAGPAAVVFAVGHLSFRLDHAAEAGMRRLGVPAPRLALAVLAGAVTGLQAASDARRGTPSPAPDRT